MTLPSDLPDRLNAEGLAHAEAGRDNLAERAFRSALALAPTHLAAAGNLGNAEARRLSLDTALGRYRWALTTAPGVPALHLMRATAEIGLGFAGRGELSLRRAIVLMPGYPKALGNLGMLLFRQVRAAEAERPFRRALACAADFAPASSGLGRLLVELARPIEARRILCRALVAIPESPDNLATLATLDQLSGRPADAARLVRRALAIRPKDARTHQQLLFTMVLDPATTNPGLYAEYRRWAARHSPPILSGARARNAEPQRPLRVGYLSADFYEHPVAYLVEDLIRRHDRSAVLPYLFAEDSRTDATTRRLKAAAQGWQSTVGLSDAEAARRIDAAAIDILVSLAGHTGDNRILIAARRPAPIQVVLHDLSTSGLDGFDYWLTDKHMHPPETTEGRTETLYRLDSLYLHRIPEGAPAVSPLPAARRGAVTFGAFASPGKLNDRVIGLWARVLENVPTAQLLLASRDAFSDPHLQQRYRDAFAAAGVAASRLLFDGRRLGRLAHLERLTTTVDIGLDPFPFTGGTATFEALWMGVPIVTLAGERFAARCGVTHLAQVGLSHLVATSENAYVDIAAKLAHDTAALEGLRQGLRERVRMSPLCDAPAYARSVERAYREMWRRWCAAGRPRP